MTLTSIQNSFSSGEMSPSLFGRNDLAKYQHGSSTCRNFFANYRGGASSRAGFAYVGTCKQPGSAAPPRDIAFQFSITQGYALEFGDQYMRIKSNGAYVTEPTNAITGITNASPGLFSYTNTNYTLNTGDWVYVTSVGGMTNFNGLTWIVQGATSSNFTLTDLFGNPVNTTLFNSYTSGGNLARIYTVVAPYAAVDLPYLKFTQSEDVMTLTCLNQATNFEYPSYQLERFGATNWTFTADNFASSIAAPINTNSTATSSTTLSTWYSYIVTAVSATTGEESVASAATNVENNDISINAGTNTITWTPVTGAGSYNVYGATPSYGVGVPVGVLYGFLGSSLGPSFTDTNIVADFTKVPPVHNNPFARGSIAGVIPTAAGTGYTQAGVGYTITTSTGSGAVIIPVVLGGGVPAYIVQNGGQGYANTDTITITGASGSAHATGTYTFTTNPTAGQNIVLNTITWTFVASGATGNQTNIQGTNTATLAQLIIDLNSSVNANLSVATYSLGSLVMTITYDVVGTIGNSYQLAAGTYGGTVSGATLTGGSNTVSATANLSVGAQSGTYPSTCAYYQQRRVYANTLNKPNTYFMSQPGAFNNMDSSVPVSDGDAIVGAPWAQQINGIQFLVPMPGGLVTLTGKGAWQVNGGNSAAITPADQTANPQAFNGCNNIVPPIVVNYDILYLQSKGSIFRDLSYNFFVNIYTGKDLTEFSNQLFDGHTFNQWCWAEEPFKIAWAVRDDGVLLSLTYLKEEDINAWAQHDTNGLFVGVTSINEAPSNGTPIDSVYCIVKRYVNGQWMYYSERMDHRDWQVVEDSFCVDAGLAYPMTYPNATLTPAAATGTNNITAINTILGGKSYTSPTLKAVDATGEGSGFVGTLTLTGGVITGYSISNPGINYQPGTVLVVTDSTGSGAILQPIITNNVTFTTSSNVFSAGNVGDVIRIGSIGSKGNGRATVTSYVSPTRVVANITQPITEVVPNNPNNMPIPAVSGAWSITTPTTVVSGINHLEGTTVAILADGSVVPNQIITNGSITLPHSASSIVIGLPYTAQLQSLYLDPKGQAMTVQSKRKNITSVAVRVQNTRGLSVGSNQPDASTQPGQANVEWDNLVQIKQRNALVTAGSAIPLFTGDEFVNISSAWDTPGQVAVQQTFPLPANVLSFISYYSVGDTGSP